MAEVVSFWASASPEAAAADPEKAATARAETHPAQSDLSLRMLRITCEPPRPAPSLRDVVAPPLMADRGRYRQKIVRIRRALPGAGLHAPPRTPDASPICGPPLLHRTPRAVRNE